MTHTKGPWRVGSPSGHNACTVHAGHEAVANVYGIALHRHVDELSARDAEGLANARLIAAAPALLDALEAYILARNDGYPQPLMEIAEAKTAAAITQARGQGK